MGYTTKVVEVGSDAEAFLAEQTAITFAGDAPEALRPYCFIIEKADLVGDLAVGQGLRIGDQQWTITALGAVNRAEGPDSFRTWLDNEIEVWAGVVRANNIKLD